MTTGIPWAVPQTGLRRDPSVRVANRGELQQHLMDLTDVQDVPALQPHHVQSGSRNPAG